MTSLTSSDGRAPSRSLHGIACVVAGMFFFAGQDAFMKSLIEVYPVWMLIIARSCVAVLTLVPLILILGAPHRLFSPLWPLHLLRATLFATGFSLFYAAFPFMGLAEATTIFFAAPLIIAVMAALFLREQIGPHRIVALVVGFAGVVIAMNPFGGNFTWIATLPLICATLYAASQILTRHIGERDTSLTMGLYTLGFAIPVVVVCGYGLNQMIDFPSEFDHLRWEFPANTVSDLPNLLLLGALGVTAYVLLSRAYQVAEASKVAPFDYTYLPIATVMAWLLWGEVPPLNTVIGMALIVLSGLYIGFRELRATQDSDETAYVAEAVVAPGIPHPVEIPDDESQRL